MLEKYFKEFADANVLSEFFSTLSDFNYIIIGGWAVAYFCENRKPSMWDIDVLVSYKDLDELVKRLKARNFNISNVGEANGYLFFSATKGEQKCDVALATNEWQEDMLKTFIDARWKKLTLRFILPEYLALLKLHAGRDKDTEDLLYLLKFANLKMKKLNLLVKEIFPSDIVDDFWALVDYSKALSIDDIKQMWRNK